LMRPARGIFGEAYNLPTSACPKANRVSG
jgi:hypothetical protein